MRRGARSSSFALVLLLLAGCGPDELAPPASPVPAPVKVERTGESGLARLILSESAANRLGIRTVPVALQRIERVRTLSGEMAAPPGRSLTLSAPLAGTIAPPPGETEIPRPGSMVEKGRSILRLAPLLSGEGQVAHASQRLEAEGEVERARIRLEAARIARDRAVQLLADKAGNQKVLDEARAAFQIAESALRTAEEKKKLLAAGGAGAPLDPIEVTSPISGVLERLHAAPGQGVPQGAPLFSVADHSRLWIRVPVYVGELSSIQTGSEVRVTGLGGGERSSGRATGSPDGDVARPVKAPPSADAASATVDLYYEIEDEERAYRPGQRVGVALPLRAEEESLVVPRGAILHDIQGGTWIYVEEAPRTYSRSRVEVLRAAGDLAVLARGPAPGSPAVVEGAAELFGVEFGAGK